MHHEAIQQTQQCKQVRRPYDLLLSAIVQPQSSLIREKQTTEISIMSIIEHQKTQEHEEWGPSGACWESMGRPTREHNESVALKSIRSSMEHISRFLIGHWAPGSSGAHFTSFLGGSSVVIELILCSASLDPHIAKSFHLTSNLQSCCTYYGWWCWRRRRERANKLNDKDLTFKSE